MASTASRKASPTAKVAAKTSPVKKAPAKKAPAKKAPAKKVSVKVKSATQSPAATLEGSLTRFDGATQALFKALRAALRKRLPSANELAYDYGSSVLIAYSPSERGIEGICSLSARAEGVRLYFNEGPRLPDPQKLLQGAGKSTRFVTLASAKQLAEPGIEALMAAAIKAAKVALPRTGKGSLIIRTSKDA